MSVDSGGARQETVQLVAELRAGRRAAATQLLPVVYGELRSLARSYMRRERPDHTLQPTALVHEAVIRLLGSGVSFQDRSHFIGIAARAMRQVLVDHARRRAAAKRGSDPERMTLIDGAGAIGAPDASIDLLALNEALTRLEELSEVQARIVELRFFGGLTRTEIAELLSIGARSVDREWQMARAWLYAELGPGRGS